MSPSVANAVLLVLMTAIACTKSAPMMSRDGRRAGRSTMGEKGSAGKPVAVEAGRKAAGGKPKCAFRPVIKGGAKIAVWAKDLTMKSRWTEGDDGSMVWKEDGGERTDSEGSGTICMSVRADKAGLYSFSTVSAAPHPTDHNDAWFRFSSPVTLYRPERNDVMVGGPGVWYKGFENEGKGKKAEYILTKDNDGHQFVLGPLQARKKYSVCVSGRSSKFRIYKFVLVKCPGDDVSTCNRHSAFMRRAMNWLPPSPCV